MNVLPLWSNMFVFQPDRSSKNIRKRERERRIKSNFIVLQNFFKLRKLLKKLNRKESRKVDSIETK